MRTLTLTILAAGALGGGGCGPKAHPPGGTTPPSSSGKERVECPTGDALTAAARTYFGARAGGDVGATCVAVYTDRALWVLDGWDASSTENGIALVTALVDPATQKAVWVTGAGDYSFPPGAIDRMTGPGMSAVDLDGDGKDEIVNISGTSAQGYDVESLAVLIIGTAGLVPAGEIPFAEDNSAAEVEPAEQKTCSTEWKLIAGPDGTKQLDLTVTVSVPGSDMCLTPGHHVMQWNGHELVEVH